MHLIFYVLIGVLSLACFSLLVLWLLASAFFAPVQIQPKGLRQRLTKAMQIAMYQKLINYFQPSKRSKRKIQYLPRKSKKLIRYAQSWAVLLLTLTNFTAFSQNDTIPKSRKDSLEIWLPFIVQDLKDYDLIKQKSYYQAEQIKGLQAISNAQKNISIRQNLKLETYSSSIIKLQNQNTFLQIEVKSTRKKLIKSKIENWLWRGGSVAGLYFIFFR